MTKQNPRPRKYASDAERQAAYRSRAAEVCVRLEPKTMTTLDSIADEIGFTRNELMQSMVKFGLTNRDWRNKGLTAHKRLPRYQENPMATKPPSAAQLAARKKFAEMARNGSLNRKRQIAAKKKAAGAAKPNPVKKTVSAKPPQLAGKVKRNPQAKSVASAYSANFKYCVEAKRSLGSAGSVFEMVAGFNTKAQAQNYIDAILASNPGVTLRIKTHK